jgi:thioredoxin 1
MKKTILLISALVVIALGGIFTVANVNKEPTPKNVNVANETKQSDANSGSSGAYMDYSPAAVSSTSEGDKVVLFFHASWCPTCKVLDQDIEANLDKIPANVRILKVDYDRETELKQKYGVRLQHALVQVDRNGEKIALWYQSPRLTDVLSELK